MTADVHRHFRRVGDKVSVRPTCFTFRFISSAFATSTFGILSESNKWRSGCSGPCGNASPPALTLRQPQIQVSHNCEHVPLRATASDPSSRALHQFRFHQLILTSTTDLLRKVDYTAPTQLTCQSALSRSSFLNSKFPALVYLQFEYVCRTQ